MQFASSKLRSARTANDQARTLVEIADELYRISQRDDAEPVRDDLRDITRRLAEASQELSSLSSSLVKK